LSKLMLSAVMVVSAGMVSLASNYADGVYHVEKNGSRTAVAEDVIIWDETKGNDSAPGYRNLSYYHWGSDAKELVLESTDTYDLKPGQKLLAVYTEGAKRELLFDLIATHGFNVAIRKTSGEVLRSVLFCIAYSAPNGYEVIGELPKSETEIDIEEHESVPFSNIARIDFSKGNEVSVNLNSGQTVHGKTFGPYIAGVALDAYMVLASTKDYRLSFVDLGDITSIEFLK
jgi:hypothetical protein